MKKAFTLVELLVTISIISIIAVIGVGSFRTTQIKGRDVQRKENLKQISNALELFYSDYGRYPNEIDGKIEGCPFDPILLTGVSCSWGTGEFTDGKTIYFKILPIDPSTPPFEYVYQLVSSNQKFKIFARLENNQDKNIDSSITTTCGREELCNFVVTSTNTRVDE